MEITINKKAVEQALNFQAVRALVAPIISEYEGEAYYDDVVLNGVEDNGNLVVFAGGGVDFEGNVVDEGYWVELKPVGELNADGKHTAYEVIGHAHI
jgi:hypothetical protein